MNTLPKNYNIEVEVLQDLSSSGRVRPWRENKLANTVLTAVYKNIAKRFSGVLKPLGDYYLSKANRLDKCARHLVFGVEENGKKRLVFADFCRVRLCPMCQWRRALKVESQMFDIIREIEKLNTYSFIHMTLSFKNISVGDDLSAEIDRLMYAWQKFTKNIVFKPIQGYYRALEIRLNEQQTEYHPHFHILLVVRKSYFHSRDYTSQATWTQAWKQAGQLDYEPHVWLKKIKDSSALFLPELIKYTAKAEDFIFPDDMALSEERVIQLDRALHQRKLICLGGIVRQISQDLKIEINAEDSDLVHIDGEVPQNAMFYRQMAYTWISGVTFANYKFDSDLTDFHNANKAQM